MGLSSIKFAINWVYLTEGFVKQNYCIVTNICVPRISNGFEGHIL